MNEGQNNKEAKPKGQEIDIMELLFKVWTNRKFILKICGIAALLALIIGFSLPKEYTTKIVLAPEIATKAGLNGSMGALASMVGVNLGNMTGEDAISPELYPKIIESTPFLTDLFDVKVSTKKGDLNTTLYEYMDKHQTQPWWGYILGAPGMFIEWTGSLFKGNKQDKDTACVNAFWLTKEQAKMVKTMKGLIGATVDKKTSVITLSVTAQDPLISASLADTVKDKLQDAIIAYRTNKARKDLVFAEKLYKEARSNYMKAQKDYADYADGNMDMAFARYEAEEARLKNEQTLAYNIYSQVAQQLQLAKAKVQEQTPVYTEVQPASVPLLASAPRKSFILITFVFLAAFGSIGWLLVRDFLRGLKK